MPAKIAPGLRGDDGREKRRRTAPRCLVFVMLSQSEKERKKKKKKKNKKEKKRYKGEVLPMKRRKRKSPHTELGDEGRRPEENMPLL